MLKIRLRRMGSRHRPFYRVVVSDSHRVPRASAIEEVGYYDPRKTPATLSMNVERVDYWMSHGAQPSNTVKKLVARARAGAEAAESEVKESEGKESKAKETETEAEAAAETAKAADDSAEAAAEGSDDSAEAEASAEDGEKASEDTESTESA